MTKVIQIIPFNHLIFAFLPVIIVMLIIWKWGLNFQSSIYAMFRMLIQLLLIGYVLTYIFATNNYLIVIATLTVMLCSASWIALQTLTITIKNLYLKSFCAIFFSGSLILFLMSQLVLNLTPWFLPSYLIPLAGMIFANSMNSVSLAGERMAAEINQGKGYQQARNIAFHASMIPITNSLLAVGLVSLPGMMTGQILSGVSPLIAVRYQIMVMCMIFSSAGMSSAIFLTLLKPDAIGMLNKINEKKRL